MRALLALALVPAIAAANGRPPMTNGVAFAPSDPHALYVRTTFGLLVSRDDGCSFRWICEQAIGYAGQFDPKYRIADDGTIFATTFTGLRVSRDGGCTFTSVEPAIWIDAIEIGPTGEVWVATAESGKPNDVFRSTDNGASFTAAGLASPTIWWKSIAIPPERAKRVYVTGYQVAGAATTSFEITDDGGAHWTRSHLAGVRFGPTPLVYAVAVDRTDPDVVYMTSIGANPPSGDRLYRSYDAGQTWIEVLATADPIRDVVVEPSGGVIVATRGGSFRSTTGIAFSRLAGAPQLACLGEATDGTLYGCAANWQPDNKAVAISRDGATWQKRFQFAELAGPLDCPAGTPTHDRCGSLWPTIRQQFGAAGPACPAPPPPPPKRVAPPSGGCCDAGGSPSLLILLALLRARRASSDSATSRRARRASGDSRSADLR